MTVAQYNISTLNLLKRDINAAH